MGQCSKVDLTIQECAPGRGAFAQASGPAEAPQGLGGKEGIAGRLVTIGAWKGAHDRPMAGSIACDDRDAAVVGKGAGIGVHRISRVLGVSERKSCFDLACTLRYTTWLMSLVSVSSKVRVVRS